MQQLFTLPTIGARPINILQLTDTHLFCDRRCDLLGINTYESFQAVLQEIKRYPFDYDLIIATGDLTQDQSLEAYRCFADMLRTFSHCPCLWLNGNHDDPVNMAKAFSSDPFVMAKEALLGDDWYMILLDSQVPQAAYGELSSHQLHWLDQQLYRYQDRHALILLHHPPIDAGCAWLDQHRLHNAEELAHILNKHPQAKTVLCGHIHQQLDQMWENCRVLATPSTCIQFKPNCQDFTLDTLNPGWRRLVLTQAEWIETVLYRIQGDTFTANQGATGY